MSVELPMGSLFPQRLRKRLENLGKLTKKEIAEFEDATLSDFNVFIGEVNQHIHNGQKTVYVQNKSTLDQLGDFTGLW